MIQVLSHLSALTTGHELWVLAEPDQSIWTQKVNWYLDFQITRAFKRPKTQINSELDKTLTAIDWNLKFDFLEKSPQTPLMISTSHKLPARWVVVVQTKELGEISQWFQKTKQVWQALMKPSIRIFLPTASPNLKVSSDFSINSMEQAFKDFEPEHTEIAIVLDPSHNSSS